MADATPFYTLAGAIVSGIITVSTLAIRSRSRERLEAIKNGTQRAAEIVRDEVEAYGVEAKNLNPADQFALATNQIKARLSRLLIVTIAFLVALVILATTAVILLLAGQPHDHPSKNNEGPFLTGFTRFLRCLPLEIDPALEVEPGTYRIRLSKNPNDPNITARACFGDQGNGGGPPTVCRGDGEIIELGRIARLFGMETNLYAKDRDLENKGLLCAPANDKAGYTMRLTDFHGTFEVLVTIAREPVAPPAPTRNEKENAKPKSPVVPGKVVQATPPVPCNYRCSGSYPGEGLDLTDTSKYIVALVENRAGGAKSFTLHNNGGSALMNVTAGERDAVVHGPGRVTICSTVPGTGGGCATHCTETPNGARLFSDEYSVTLSIVCR